MKCLDQIESFHTFYTRVYEIHNSLVKQHLSNVSKIKSEIGDEESNIFENVEVDMLEDDQIKEESHDDPPVKSEESTDEDSNSSSSDDEFVRPKPVKKKVKTPAKRKPKDVKAEKTPKKYNMSPKKSKEEFAAEDEMIRKNMAMFCDLCDAKFDTFAECCTHYRTIHQIAGYLKCCGKKITKRCRVMSHIGWHIDPSKFKYDNKLIYAYPK